MDLNKEPWFTTDQSTPGRSWKMTVHLAKQIVVDDTDPFSKLVPGKITKIIARARVEENSKILGAVINIAYTDAKDQQATLKFSSNHGRYGIPTRLTTSLSRFNPQARDTRNSLINLGYTASTLAFNDLLSLSLTQEQSQAIQTAALQSAGVGATGATPPAAMHHTFAKSGLNRGILKGV